RRFDVALWRWWPSEELPVVVKVEAVSVRVAVEWVMREQRWRSAAHVSVNDLVRRRRRSADGVRLAPGGGFVGKKVVVSVEAGPETIDNAGVMDHVGVSEC